MGKDKDEISSCGLNVVSLPLLLTSMESNLISQAQYLECLSLWSVKRQCCRRKTDTPLGWILLFFSFSPQLGLHQSSSAYSLVLVQTLLTQPRVELVHSAEGWCQTNRRFKATEISPPWTIPHVCSEISPPISFCFCRQSGVPGSVLCRQNAPPTGSAHRLSVGFHRTITAAYGEERGGARPAQSCWSGSK